MGCNHTKAKSRDMTLYLEYFNKRSGQGRYFMRELALSDIKNGAYLRLMKQLKTVDAQNVDDETLQNQILDIFHDETYIILIWTYPVPKNYIVASASLHFQKSIGDKFTKSAHLSHVVVDQEHQNRGLGKTLQEVLTVIAFREEKVKKLIDDTEFVEENKPHKVITNEDFEASFSDLEIGSEPQEIRFLDHKTLVVSMASFVKYDEDKRGDKQFLVSCSLDPNLKVWDLEANSCLQTIESTHTKTLTTCLSLVRENSYQLLTASMGQIQLHDLTEGVLVSCFFGHKGSITCLVQAPESLESLGFNFLSGSEDETIKTWKYESSDPVGEINVGLAIKSMVELAEKEKFVVFVGLAKGKIMVYDPKALKLLNTFTHTEKNNEYVSALEILPKSENEALLLSGCSDGSICVWDAKRGNLLKTYQETSQIISCLEKAFLNQKIIFISGSLDEKNGEVKLWSLDQDKSLKTFKNHGFGVKSMCYLEKYEFLAVSWNNGFRVLKLGQ